MGGVLHSACGAAQCMWCCTVHVVLHSACGVAQCMWFCSVHVVLHSACGSAQCVKNYYYCANVSYNTDETLHISDKFLCSLPFHSCHIALYCL